MSRPGRARAWAGRDALLDDSKVGVVAREAAPSHIDALNPSGARASIRPRDELLQSVLLSFGEDLDTSIGAIFHPAGEAQALGFALRRRAEEDTLHTATNKNLDLLQTHRIGERNTRGSPFRQPSWMAKERVSAPQAVMIMTGAHARD